MAMSGRTTWILQSDRITVVDDLTARRATANLSLQVTASSTPVLLLDPDPASARLWIVVEGASPGPVIEYDAFTLARIRDLHLPEIGSGAAFGRQVYVTSGTQLIDIPPGAAALLHVSGAPPTPVDVSPLEGTLGAAALIVASGQRVFWVRSGSGGDDLWCVNAATGRVAQHWNLTGAVASTAGTAVIATGTGAAALHLSGCAG